MHHINCKICSATLKIKKIPVGKEKIKLRCPKCKKIFSADIESLLSKKDTKIETPSKDVKGSKISEDYLDQILASTSKKRTITPDPNKKETEPKAKKQEILKTKEEEESDIFFQEKKQELYHIIKPNGEKLGPYNYADLLQVARDGDITGIDMIKSQSGTAKSPSSFIDLKRILQEKLLEQSIDRERSLGIDHTYSGTIERRKTTLYLLLILFGIVLIIYLFVSIPQYFQSPPTRPIHPGDMIISDLEDFPETIETEEEIPEVEEEIQQIINFSRNSIIRYFEGTGSQYRPALNQLRAGNYREAIRELDRVIHRSGISPTVVILKLQVYFLWENLEVGLTDFETMRAVSQEDPRFITMGLGAIHTMLGNYSQARSFLDQVRYLDPQNPLFLYYNGVLYYRMGDYSKAESFLLDAGRNSPSGFVFNSDIQNLIHQIRQKQNS